MQARLRATLLGAALAFSCASAPALAEASAVEQAAVLGGRIIGAAKACGINAERVRSTSERLLTVIGANAGSQAEKDATKVWFTTSQAAGMAQARADRSKCHGIHVEFSEMEVKLGRAPAANGDGVLAKRGVPALGALKQDTATRRP